MLLPKDFYLFYIAKIAKLRRGSEGGGGGIPSEPEINSASNVTMSGFRARWLTVVDATGYFIDVASDPQFSELLLDNYDVGNALFLDVEAEYETWYYRVRAYNSYGTSGNSQAISVDVPPPYDLTDGLVSVYTFNDLDDFGEDALGPNHLTLFNNPVYAATIGVDGFGAEASPVLNDYLGLADAPDTFTGKNGTAFTITFIGSATDGSYSPLWACRSAFGMDIRGGGALAVWTSNGDGSFTQVTNDDYDLSDEIPRLFTFTYDGDGHAKIYINADSPISLNAAPPNNSGSLWNIFGSGDSNTAVGQTVDQFMVYDRVLSADEISWLYNSGDFRVYPNWQPGVPAQVESPAALSDLDSTPSFNQIALTWSATDSLSRSVTIQISEDEESWTTLGTADYVAETYNATNLNDSTEYFFRVTVLGLGGSSSYAYTQATTLELVVPPTPDNFVLLSYDSNSASFDWDDVDPSPDGYQIGYSTNNTDFTYGELTYYTSGSLADLQPNTGYYFHVVAVLNSVLSVPSTGVFQTTDPAPYVPEAPPQATGFGYDIPTFTLSWSELGSSGFTTTLQRRVYGYDQYFSFYDFGWETVVYGASPGYNSWSALSHYGDHVIGETVGVGLVLSWVAVNYRVLHVGDEVEYFGTSTSYEYDPFD